MKNRIDSCFEQLKANNEKALITFITAGDPDMETTEKLEAIPGTPPDMILPPKGDAFAARNKYAMQIDFEQQPPAFQVSDIHWAATWLLHAEGAGGL